MADSLSAGEDIGDEAGGVSVICGLFAAQSGVTKPFPAADLPRGFNVLEGVRELLRAWPVKSRRALREELGLFDTRFLGVKNSLKRRGVMEGFALACPDFVGIPGGEDGGGDRSPVRGLLGREGAMLTVRGSLPFPHKR